MFQELCQKPVAAKTAEQDLDLLSLENTEELALEANRLLATIQFGQKTCVDLEGLAHDVASQEEGLTAQGAFFAQRDAKTMCAAVGATFQTIDTESLDSEGGRLEAQELTLLSIGTEIKKIWDRIVAFVKTYVDKVKKFMIEKFSSAARLEKAWDALAKKAKDTKGTMGETEVEMSASKFRKLVTKDSDTSLKDAAKDANDGVAALKEFASKGASKEIVDIVADTEALVAAITKAAGDDAAIEKALLNHKADKIENGDEDSELGIERTGVAGDDKTLIRFLEMTNDVPGIGKTFIKFTYKSVKQGENEHAFYYVSSVEIVVKLVDESELDKEYTVAYWSASQVEDIAKANAKLCAEIVKFKTNFDKADKDSEKLQKEISKLVKALDDVETSTYASTIRSVINASSTVVTSMYEGLRKSTDLATNLSKAHYGHAKASLAKIK